MVEPTFSLQPLPPAALPPFGAWKLFKSDATSWLHSLPTESVDLVITDPAYESLEKHRAVGTTTRLTNAWFPVVPNSYFVDFFRELHRVMKRDTHAYIFCDAETMFAIKPMGEAAGLTFWKPIVWEKQAIGMGYHYRAKHEFILFFEKGKRMLTDLGMPDVLSVKRIRGGYPTEKPLALLDMLVTQSSVAGELVIDPFFGSGATGVAAVTAERRFLGSDISGAAFEMATARLMPFGRGDGK